MSIAQRRLMVCIIEEPEVATFPTQSQKNDCLIINANYVNHFHGSTGHRMALTQYSRATTKITY